MTKHRSNEIVQLSEIQHVLKKSGMWIGDSSRSKHSKWYLKDGKMVKESLDVSPGLLKLFDEIISNSIDEALRTNFDFANKIDVLVEGNTITVKDNGRGIPVVKSKGSDITQAEMAFTSLRAGSNFGEDAVVSIGTHGLGSTLVNIMSTVFRAETCDGKKKLSLTCTNNLSTTKRKITKSTKKGTSVEFTIDFNQFDGSDNLTDVDMMLIQKRLLDLTVCFPKIQFTLNKKKLRQGAISTAFKKYVALYDEQFAIVETDDFKVAVFPVEEPTHVSFVNGIDTYDGGTHVNVAQNIIIPQMLEVLKKKYKKLDIKPTDIKNHLGFIVFTNSIKAAKFTSQTKEKIANPASEITPVFQELKFQQKFYNSILKNSDLIDPIIETKKLKLEAKERAAAKKAAKANKKIKVASHVPANSKDPRKKILFLSEGASASGQLLSVRDPNIHGSYPLRGKVMNVTGKKPSAILKNQELKNLMSIVGLELGSKAVDLNYGKIGLLMDADVDGNSIAGLLFNFFKKWPELFEQERIVLVKTPIVIAKKGKNVKRYYSLTDYNKESSKLSNWDVTYIKGLGSLPIDEYKKIINDPIFIPIKIDNQGMDMLEIAFGNDSSRRKEWLAE